MRAGQGESERMVTTSGEETRLFCVKDSMLREAPWSDAKSSRVSSSIVCASMETPAPTEKKREKERDRERQRESMRRNEGINGGMDAWMDR